MRLRVARSLCPDLTVLPPQPERQARAFETVMDALDRLLADPLVLRPGLAISGARGPARWAGGEETLAAALVEAVAERADAECQVGIGEGLAGAILAARRGIIVPSGATPAFLEPWPLEALLAALPLRRQRHEARALVETFSRLGLRTLGDLAALPGRDVAARFGVTGARLHRLASGIDHEAQTTPRPVGDLTVETLLDPPVERTDTAAFAARSLAEDLAAGLLSAGASAGRLLVEAHCQDGAELARSWALETAPTVSELTDRVRWQLEGWLAGRSGRPPASPLTRLRLSALEISPAGAGQAGLWKAPGEQAGARAARAAERVESLLGAGGIQAPLLTDGRDPRSRARLIPWGERADPTARSAQATRGARTAQTTQARSPQTAPWAGALPRPSPSIVLARPIPVTLTDAQGRQIGVDIHGQIDAAPALVSIEGEMPWDHHPEVRGRAQPWASGPQQVTSWAGPWPLDEGWWTPQGAWQRAYLQVTTDAGPPLLLMRAGQWWLEAIYS
ncbi:DNA polymerase Y family protein [Actinomyces slackii]